MTMSPPLSSVQRPGIAEPDMPGREMAPGIRQEAAFAVAVEQALIFAAILCLSVFLALVGMGRLSRFVYPALCFAGAAYYLRRSPWQYLTFTLWVWTLSALVRRMIDFHAGYEQVNLVIVTPNLVSLLMLGVIFRSAELFSRPQILTALLVVGSVEYGMVVSLVSGDVFPAAAAAADWITPILYYFLIILAFRDIDRSWPYMRAFLLINIPVVAIYAINQYLAMYPWDAFWIAHANMASLGRLMPAGQLRPFGTLNNPGFLGLLLLAQAREKIAMVIIPIAVFTLFLSMVRSAWGSAALSFGLMSLLVGREGLRVLGVAVLALALMFGSLPLMNPKAADRIIDRVQTLQDLNHDDSATTRESILQSTMPIIAAHPYGLGIGAVGRGAVADDDSALATIDFGPLAIYLALGWVAGSLYLIGLFLLAAEAFLGAQRAGGPVPMAYGAIAVGLCANIVFVNPGIGFIGVLQWITAGLATAYGMRARFAPLQSAEGRKISTS